MAPTATKMPTAEMTPAAAEMPSAMATAMKMPSPVTASPVTTASMAPATMTAATFRDGIARGRQRGSKNKDGNSNPEF
jgi:hypothetical protein